jgi:hypothetical protein
MFGCRAKDGQREAQVDFGGKGRNGTVTFEKPFGELV